MCMAFGYKSSKRSREEEENDGEDHDGSVMSPQQNKKLVTSHIADIKILSTSSSSSSSSLTPSLFISLPKLLSSSSNMFANFIYNCLFDNSVSTINESSGHDGIDDDIDDAFYILRDKEKNLKVVREWLISSPWPIFNRCYCSSCKITSLPTEITKWLNGDDSISWEVNINLSFTECVYFSITPPDAYDGGRCLSTHYFIVFELLPLHLQKKIQKKMIKSGHNGCDAKLEYDEAKDTYVNFVSYLHFKNINDSIIKIVHSYLLLPPSTVKNYGVAEALVSTILDSNIHYLWQQKLKKKFDGQETIVPNWSHWHTIDLSFSSRETTTPILARDTIFYSILIRKPPHCTFCYPYVYYGSDLMGGSTIEKGLSSDHYYYDAFSWTCPYCFTFWRYPTPSGSLHCHHWKMEGSTTMKDYCCICKRQSY